MTKHPKDRRSGTGLYSAGTLAAFCRELDNIYGLSPASGDSEPLDRPTVLRTELRSLLYLHACALNGASGREGATGDEPRSAPFAALQRHGITPRECQVMLLLGQGLSDSEAANKLGCSSKTVSKHVEHILAKTGAETRLGAVDVAYEWLHQSRD